jgi:cystathionine beta-lyase/cystathionine gamma-synthase
MALKLVQGLIYAMSKKPKKQLKPPENVYWLVDGSNNEYTAMLCFDFKNRNDAEEFVQEFKEIFEMVFNIMVKGEKEDDRADKT